MSNSDIWKSGSILEQLRLFSNQPQAVVHEEPKRVKKIKKNKDLNRNTLSPTEDLNLLNKVCLKRDYLLNQSTKFYFEDQIRDCLVKVHFGSQDRVDSYRIGVIESVVKKS